MIDYEEACILHESGDFYVYREHSSYTVYKPAPSRTHAISDSSYPLTPDGFSIAVARCDYLSQQAEALLEIPAVEPRNPPAASRPERRAPPGFTPACGHGG